MEKSKLDVWEMGLSHFRVARGGMSVELRMDWPIVVRSLMDW